MSKRLERLLVALALVVVVMGLWGGQVASAAAQAGIDGPRQPDSLPIQVTLAIERLGTRHLGNVAAISAGGDHTCALRTKGTVWCWGYGRDGELGDGTRGDADHQRLRPVEVVLGSGHLGSVTAISAGEGHTCALRTKGTVWCWGSDYSGQLGDGTTGKFGHDRLTPVKVVLGSGFLRPVKAISAGNFHTCALTTNGRVWCWGYDRFGQLGDGTRGDANGARLTPVEVVLGSGHLGSVAAITAGLDHTCALRMDGTVWCWGANNSGELGDGTLRERLTPGEVVLGSSHLGSVAAISAGWDHTCALRTNGTVWCWGNDYSGQLGDGTTGNTSHLRLTPVQVANGHLRSVATISAGGSHTCALRSDETVWCWGYDSEGQLGDGTTGNSNSDRLTPTEVVLGSDGNLGSVAAVSGGDSHTCALKTKGTAWCWGLDGDGQLGDGTRGDPSFGDGHHLRLTPVKVVAP